MESRHNEEMERTYDRRLEKDFVGQLKGRAQYLDFPEGILNQVLTVSDE